MATTVTVEKVIPAPEADASVLEDDAYWGRSVPISFPRSCACCLAPAVTTVVTSRTSGDVAHQVLVPYCEDCKEHAEAAAEQTTSWWNLFGIIGAAFFCAFFFVEGAQEDSVGAYIAGSVCLCALVFIVVMWIVAIWKARTAVSPSCTTTREAVRIEHCMAVRTRDAEPFPGLYDLLPGSMKQKLAEAKATKRDVNIVSVCLRFSNASYAQSFAGLNVQDAQVSIAST